MPTNPQDDVPSIYHKLRESIPGAEYRLRELKHGLAVRRVVKGNRLQVAAGYLSRLRDGNFVEFAFNQHELTDTELEREAFKVWITQQQDTVGRESDVHQRGKVVDWMRIGFASEEDASSFLAELKSRLGSLDALVRWEPVGGTLALGPGKIEAGEAAGNGEPGDSSTARPRARET